MDQHQVNGQAPAYVETAYDWEEERRKKKDFSDDGTTTYFWRAHTMTVLIIFTSALFYVAVFEEVQQNSDYNTKRGLAACFLAFVLFGITHMPDGPFRRPHPAFWRLILCLSIIYELVLVFILFQTADDARQLLTNIDSTLGKPLPEKDYGGNCRIYDPENPTNPWHNLWDKMDEFVYVHLFGWWFKTLILRDYWLCMVLSILFEISEYTLQHQLPNFNECWWDHWIMDFLICNGLGIYVGMKTLCYLSMKPYHWRGMWNIPTYRGKIGRMLSQLTPYVWTDFDWRPTSSLKRWIAMLGIISFFILAELNLFFLKWVLWIPPPHFLVLARGFFFLFIGAVSLRETFQFLDDPNCKKIGPQVWLIMAIVITELLIALKFDWNTFTKPPPSSVMVFWSVSLTILGLWTLWHFYLQRLLLHTEAKLSRPPSQAVLSPAAAGSSHTTGHAAPLLSPHEESQLLPQSAARDSRRSSNDSAVRMRLRGTMGDGRAAQADRISLE